MAAFDYTIKHKPGKANVLADALSRLPNTLKAQSIATDCVPIKAVLSQGPLGITAEEVQQASERDGDFTSVQAYLRNGWPGEHALPPALVPYYHNRSTLTWTEDGLLVHADRIVVPQEFRQKVLSLAHSGHPEIVRTMRLLRTTYWWPDVNKAVEVMIMHCLACQASDKSAAG